MGATTGGGEEEESNPLYCLTLVEFQKSAGRECSLNAPMHMVYFSLDPCELGSK